ncbi:MAG: metallophosphoesterase [Phycisphaerae bacterium]|nr:metallophosphoesterase [Phycisphaerae bacterium]
MSHRETSTSNSDSALSQGELLSPQRAGCEPIPPRWLWATNRFRMETENRRTRRYGKYGRQHWLLLHFLMGTLKIVLKASRQYNRGLRNARRIRVEEIDLPLEALPPAFDGYTILHVSDPHFDAMPGLAQQAAELWGGRTVDACVLTGDYRRHSHGLHREAIRGLEHLLKSIPTRDGVFGVLGNHDDCHMVQSLESLGVAMLINEHALVRRGDQSLRFVGVDDVHYYFTDQAVDVLERTADGTFRILLAHSPELFAEAAELGVNLYLCGHTHGGQVCLPGGVPVICHLDKGRRFARGLWRYKGMVGVTNRGLGTSGPAVRFNCPGHLLLLRLRRGTEHV